MPTAPELTRSFTGFCAASGSASDGARSEQHTRTGRHRQRHDGHEGGVRVVPSGRRPRRGVPGISSTCDRVMVDRPAPPDRERSDDLDGNSAGVGGERFDVGSVTGENRPTGLGESNNESTDCGSGSGESAKLSCSPCCRLTHRRVDDAHLQESVSVGVASRVAVEGLDQHHRRHDRRPQFVCPKGSDERHSSLGLRREARQSSAVEYQHGSTDSIEQAIPDASCDCIRCGPLPVAGLSDLSNQLVEVPIRLGERVLSLQLGPKCDLQKLRGRKVALLELLMEVVGEVHLNPWHTPNYTPSSSADQRAVSDGCLTERAVRRAASATRQRVHRR
jgi:hypothetical protein